MTKEMVVRVLITALVFCGGCGKPNEIEKTNAKHSTNKANKVAAEPNNAPIPTGSVYAATDSKIWDGFQGLRWGTNIKNINDPNIILVMDNDKKTLYVRKNDKLSIGTAKLGSIVYGCYKDRFFMLLAETKGYTNFTNLKNAVFGYYGVGKQDGKEKQTDEAAIKWEWRSDLGNSSKNIRMVLVYNERSEKTMFTIIYVPIWKEKDADKVKKEKSYE